MTVAADEAKRARVRERIEADPHASNRDIAKALGIGRDTVNDVRRTMNGGRAMAEGDAKMIDVFSLPVHPWAARFPMRSDEDLDAMAASIKANGQRIPVALGKAVVEDGSPPVLCVIDGRNRIAACKRAGVTPNHVMLNGEDMDAFIADANLHRRDLTKGQKAMLWAIRYPNREQGKKTSVKNTEVSSAYVDHARVVNDFCKEMIQQVIDGTISLNEAYAEAQRRRQVGQATDSRYETLRMSDPDLADLVNEERMKLTEAEAAARDRREREANVLRSHAQAMKEINTRFATLTDAAMNELAKFYKAKPEHFHTEDLISNIDAWIEKAQALREKLQ